MSVTITTASGATVEHEQGIDLQVNDDGTLVVFGEPKNVTTGSKNRIAMYAPVHWSSATVDQGPSKPEQIVAAIEDLKESTGDTDVTEALDEVLERAYNSIISPPKVQRSNPIDREAMLRMEREQTAAEAGRKASHTHVSKP